MKITVYIILVASFFAVLACSSSKQVVYSFPDEMSADIRKSYIENCNKGKVYYELHCEGCHTVKKWGKKLVPDFTPEQLEAYQVRVANAIHEPIMNDEQLPADELAMIVAYLSYKPKSGIKVEHKSLDRH